MVNSTDTSIGAAVEHLGKRVLNLAETLDDNQAEALAFDAVALIITGQDHEPTINALSADHPVRAALSELAASLQALLDDQAQ